MTTFIIIFTLSLSVCGYFGYRIYQEISNIMEAKRIQDKMVQDHFWSSQQSFEE
jgi:predicted nucleic acid-binding protein